MKNKYISALAASLSLMLATLGFAPLASASVNSSARAEAALTATVTKSQISQTATHANLETSGREDLERALKEFIEPTGKTVPYKFNREKAIQAGASQDLLKMGDEFNAYIVSQYDKQSRLKIWGHWCGPAYGGGVPTDTLDTACMHHDKCYEAQGYFSCDCDQQLIDEINDNFYKMHGAERATAIAVKTYFTLQKLWCKYYPVANAKQMHQLAIEQKGWYVARYEISWEEKTGDTWQKKTWVHNDKQRSIRSVDFVEIPADARAVHVKLMSATGAFWHPWRTFMDKDLDLSAGAAKLTLHGTVFSPYVEVK